MQAARFFKTLLFIFGIFLSLAATVFATGQPRRYNENSTVKGTISQSFYQVNAKTDVAVKSIAVTGTLYEKGTFGTWQKISSCSNTSAFRTERFRGEPIKPSSSNRTAEKNFGVVRHRCSGGNGNKGWKLAVELYFGQ